MVRNTIARMTAQSGLSRITVQRWVKRMHAAGECHIVAWERTCGAWAPVYQSGAGEDKPCHLRRLPGASYSRKHRRAVRADVERHMSELAKRRAASAVARAREGKMTDPIVAALFGTTQTTKA